MKMMAFLMLVVMTATAVSLACAATVPSKTTQDLAKVVSVTSDVGAAMPDDLLISLLKETESADKALKQLVEFTDQGLAPVRFFNETVQGEIASMLPGGADPDQLVIDEFSPMIVKHKAESSGGVTASFQFATVYEDGQTVVVLVGIVTGTDAQGNPVIDWTPIRAEVENGLVKAYFPEELLTLLNSKDAMIAVLSET